MTTHEPPNAGGAGDSRDHDPIEAIQRAEQAERLATVSDFDREPRKRRRWPRVLGGIVLVLLVVVALAPTIAGPVLRPVLEDRLAEALESNVRIERVSLGWLSGPKVEGLRIVDGSLQEQANLSIELGSQLFRLVTSPRELGKVSVSGKLVLERRADGSISPLPRPDPDAEGSLSLPDLSVVLSADALDVEWRETGRDPVRLAGIDGAVIYRPERIAGQLAFDVEHAVGGGRVELSLEASDLAATDGALSVGSGGGAIRIAGEAVEADIGVQLDPTGDGRYRVTLTGDEATARVGGPLLAAIVPELARLTSEPVIVGDGRAFRLDEVPSASLVLSRAAATIDPSAWSVPELRGEVVLETSRLTGTLGDSVWTVEPLLATAATRTVADGIDVEAVTAVTLDGERAGEVSLLADALRVLDARGAPAASTTAMLAGSRATLDVTEIATAVVEPLLAPLLARTGVALSRDLGPTASAELALVSGDQTDLRLGLRSDNVEAAFGFTVEAGVLRSTADSSRVSVRSAGAPLTELLGGVQIDEGAALDLQLSSFALDLNAQRPGQPLDLRSLSGVINASVGRTAGRAVINGAERPFVLRPSDMEIDFGSIGERVTLVAGAAVEIDGRPAGALNASIEAGGLLDPSGALQTGVPTLSGELALRSVRGDLLDTWLADAGVSSTDLVGASADLLIIGTRTGDDARITATLSSGVVEGKGEFTIIDRVIEADGPITVRHENAGAILSTGRTGALAVAPGGRADLDIAALRFGPGGLERLEAALQISGLAVTGRGERAASVERLNASARFEGADASVEINGVGGVDDAPLVVGGRFVLPVGPGGRIDPLQAPPEGRLDITLPKTALELVSPETSGTLANVLDAMVGDTLTLGLAVRDGRIAAEASGATDAMAAELGATIGGGALRVTGGEVRATISEEIVRQVRLARAASPDAAAGGIALGSPAELALRVGPFGVFEGGGLASSETAAIRLEASGTVVGLRTETVIGSDGLPRTLPAGEIGAEGLIVEASLPVGALLGEAEAELTGAIRGTATGIDGAPIAPLTGSIAAGLAGGRLDGAISVSLGLDDIDTALIDDSLLTDSFFAGLLGASASASIELSGLSEAGRLSDAGVTLGLASPRLSTDAPVVLDLASDRLTLAEPVAVSCRLDPVFATRHLLNQPAGDERARLTQPIAARLTLDRLTLGRGDERFRAGLFDAHADIAAPAVVFEHRAEVEDGVDIADAPWVRSDFSPLTGEVRTESDGTVAVDLAAGSQNGDRSVVVEARVRDLATGRGVVSLLVEGVGVPTAVIGGAAHLQGLAEIAGPTSRLRLGVQNLSNDSGDVNVSFVGDRATARLIGRVEDGIFRNADPVSMQVDVIRPQLGRALARAVPAIGRVTKTREDGPATFTATDVAMPINADKPLNELDADFTIDIGTARFEASTAFGELLKVARQPVDNQVGRKLEPMIGTVRQGQIAYDRFRIPLGEFTLISEGAYNLGTRRTDITTYIPVGALSDKAMGVLNTGLGSQLARLIPGLERLTMIPWRVTGEPGNLTVRPDIDALRKDLTRLLNPVNLIDGVINGADSLINGNGDKQPNKGNGG